jgi:hypothetical protein
MDVNTPTLIGTGLVILGAVVWIVCAVYAYQNAPKFGRSAGLWAVLAILFGPLALMALYVLPKRQPASSGDHAAKKAGHQHEDPQAALYEVPKDKHRH